MISFHFSQSYPGPSIAYGCYSCGEIWAQGRSLSLDYRGWHFLRAVCEKCPAESAIWNDVPGSLEFWSGDVGSNYLDYLPFEALDWEFNVSLKGVAE